MSPLTHQTSADALTQIGDDEIDQDATSDLVKCFKETAPSIYESVPRESLRLAAEIITYIAEIKLETAASSRTHSPSSGTRSQFEHWEEVLDSGLISGLQVRTISAVYPRSSNATVVDLPRQRQLW